MTASSKKLEEQKFISKWTAMRNSLSESKEYQIEVKALDRESNFLR
jgi:hypothetical protein